MLLLREAGNSRSCSANNGWIDLDVEDHADWDEFERLLMTSYRHFALKRMLTALGD